MSTLERVNREEIIRWVSSSPFVEPEGVATAPRGGRAKHIAVVGLSDNPSRPSHRVAQALQEMGYRIIPVNPTCDTVLGERCYPTISSLPAPVEIVQVFRRPEHTPAIAREVVQEKDRLGIRVLWLQEGVVNDEAAQVALDAGIDVVMDRCIYKEIVQLPG